MGVPRKEIQNEGFRHVGTHCRKTPQLQNGGLKNGCVRSLATVKACIKRRMPARRTHCQKIPRLQNSRLKNSCGRSLVTANGCNSAVLPSSSNNREGATVVERLQELSQAQAQIDEV